ncbi:hypothetical protein N0V82_008752 [Gnomoniopsis sp. IMI 355080]|nr:hypothetical protein N0V82_008752 [Gnomoniopsis sp. IMI 355080]
MSAPQTSAPVASSAMEAFLTTSSSTEWQSFLLQTMQAISGPLARNMIARIGLGASTTEPFTLLDHGCGLGVVAPVLMETVPRDVLERSSVVSADLSEKLVESVQARSEREGWVNCEARVVDAQNSGLPSESFTHVVSNIMYHTVPDSQAALKDSIRLLRPGGTLAFTTWHASNPSWIVFLRDAIASPAHFPPELLPPDFTFHVSMNMSNWGCWDDVDWVRDALSDANACGVALEDVGTEVLANSWLVENAEHFMKVNGKMIDMVVGMLLNEDSIGKLGGKEGIKARVKGYLEERYGTRGWTCIGVSILAWGKKPVSESHL